MSVAKESRILPEIKTDIPVVVKDAESEIHGNCVRISLKRIHASLSQQLQVGSLVTLVISTDELNRNLSVTAEVADVKKSNNENHFISFDIVEAEREDEKQLSYFYISTLWREVFSRIPDRTSFFVPRNLVGLFEEKKVFSTLKDLMTTESIIYFTGHNFTGVAKISFRSEANGEFLFKIIEASSSLFEAPLTDPLYVFWAAGFRQHLFVAYPKELSKDTLVVKNPVLLLSSSLREEERTVVDPGTMWVEIPVPYPKGATIKREIIDISSGGFAFKCPIDSAYFLPGTPISTLRIFGKNREPFVSAGQIRHVTPVVKDSEEPYLKIGVQLQISNKAFAKGHSQPQLVKRARKPVREKAPAKPRGSIINTFKQVLKTGVRPQIGQEGSGTSREATDTIRFTTLNKRNQEIVGFLNTTWKTSDRRRATVVVLPPPYGKRKEALGLCSHYFIERFRNQYNDAVVVRYDSTNHIGDSYKDPQCREPWKECLHMTLSQGTEDLLSVLDFVENNDYFLAKDIILISFSIGALFARKAIVKDRRKRTHLWIAPMGATDMGDLLIKVSGGIDYFDLYRSGKHLGEVTILGITVGGDRFCEDALAKGYVTLEEAIEDMSRIDIPVMWLYGAYDSWIDPDSVEKLMAAKQRGWKKIKIIPTGHLPLNGEEALGVFETIFEEMWPFISREEMVDFSPNLTELIEKQELEWKLSSREFTLSKRQYWSNYLMGEDESDLGYDILRYCEEYVEFIREQIRLLDVKDNQKVADMGCGTGNLVLQFVEDFDRDPASFPTFTLVDLVYEALTKARDKCLSSGREKGIEPDAFEIVKADLDIHQALPIKKFLLGEYCTLDDLRGQIPAITNYTINLWKKNFSRRLYYILRGKKITDKDIEYLDSIFPREEKKIILEFNKVSTIIRQMIAPLCPFISFGTNNLTNEFQQNDFRLLGIDLKNVVFRLPFENELFDRIVSSLVLSYMKNPLDTLAEFSRCLKPGGIMVISSMKPDTDMSTIFTKMVDRLNKGTIPVPPGQKERYLKAVRDFANSAAQLIQLVDERKFRFFHLEELLEMTQEVGLEVITVSESYGNPAQAFIVKARK